MRPESTTCRIVQNLYATEEYSELLCLQQTVKKRMVYVPIVFVIIWVICPAFDVLLSCFTSDIIDGVCVPLAIYSSVAAEKTVAASVIFVGYFLPLALMIFCYSRVVYAIRTKVTSHHQSINQSINQLNLYIAPYKRGRRRLTIITCACKSIA